MWGSLTKLERRPLFKFFSEFKVILLALSIALKGGVYFWMYG